LVSCDWCEKEFERAPSNIGKYNFCSRGCKEEAQSLRGGFVEIQPEHYGGGKSSYRKRAFEHYPHECEVCRYDEHIELLQVHHIDSDHDNSGPENLVILCPTCHWGLTLRLATFSGDRVYGWIGKRIPSEKDKLGGRPKGTKEISEDVIALVLDLRESGVSFPKIANMLNDDGVETARGGKWYPASVKFIFDRYN
jgi:5-methylcytosine-specific restriction endonuclease McrA